MIPHKIQAILDKDYDHETPDKPRSKEFCSAVKAWVKSTVAKQGGLIAGNVTGYREASGFIVWKDGLCTYFNIQFDSDEFLIRSARDTKDYTGGQNHRCYFHEFETESRRVALGGGVWHK